MNKRLLFFYFLSFFALPLMLCAQGNTPTKTTDNDSLKIGVAGNEPFVINNKDTGKFEGIAIDVWEAVAERGGLNYKYKSYQTVEKALHAVQNGQIDMAAGPISITSERIPDNRFSQPFYQSSLSIASRNDDFGLWSRIKPLFSLQMLIAVSGFLLILAIVGTLLWLAERHASPEQFPADPKRGIGNGMWLAIVTMSTTGYGDMAPVTLRGRVIAGAWMVITLIFATSMVAGIASTLTLTGLGSSTVTNVEELSGKKTATVTGSPAEGFIKEHKSKVVPVNSLADAMEKLKNRKVDAVIYDRPQMLYYKQSQQADDIYISKAEYYKQGYGFAFPLQSEKTRPVNLKLLELSEHQQIKQVVEDYIGSEN